MKRFFIICIIAHAAITTLANADSTAVQAKHPLRRWHEQKQEQEDIEVQVFPNPFGDELNIRCEKADIKQLEIWSTSHKMMFNSLIEIPQGIQMTINTGSFATGYYVVKILFENSTKTIGITKN